MPESVQVKLLRVIEGHPFERVGGSDAVSVDVRVIAATNTRLSDEVTQGTFRQDLFFRLNLLSIKVYGALTTVIWQIGTAPLMLLTSAAPSTARVVSYLTDVIGKLTGSATTESQPRILFPADFPAQREPIAKNSDLPWLPTNMKISKNLSEDS
jgi:hypothetical protein